MTPETLPNHKLKTKVPRQRACNEKDAKGKICGGHLKRWAYWADAIESERGDVARTFGPQAEIYRCEHCKTLYLPNAEDPRVNSAGVGPVSEFGLTLPPKTDQPQNAQASGADPEKKVKDALPADKVEKPEVKPEGA